MDEIDDWQEVSELETTGKNYSKIAFKITPQWLPKWWKMHGLPVDDDGNIRGCHLDLWLHAGAVSLAWYFEQSGVAAYGTLDVPSLNTMAEGFARRVLSSDPDLLFDDSGTRLFGQMTSQECKSLSLSNDLKVPLAIKVEGFDDEAIDDLGSLLIDYADVLENDNVDA